MEPKDLNQLRLLDFQLNTTKDALNHELSDNIAEPNQNSNKQLLSPEQLWAKRSVILSRPNDHNTEGDFRTACLSNKRNSTSSPQLNEAYQGYVKAYHTITSLYLTKNGINGITNLIIYDTENEEKQVKVLETPETLDYGTCIAQLPNGELFCFSNWDSSGITLIIDNDYKVRELPSGPPCSESSAIYFNRNVYCFGGNLNHEELTFSWRFDLDKNRWMKLTPMPKADQYCHSIIFNGNILISGYENKNLLRYSIDIDSFSIIPYKFKRITKKILINAESLYVIGCSYEWTIYESKTKDEYDWELVKKWVLSLWPSQVYCTYNKGAIYMITSEEICCNFHLSKKKISIF